MDFGVCVAIVTSFIPISLFQLCFVFRNTATWLHVGGRRISIVHFWTWSVRQTWECLPQGSLLSISSLWSFSLLCLSLFKFSCQSFVWEPLPIWAAPGTFKSPPPECPYSEPSTYVFLWEPTVNTAGPLNIITLGHGWWNMDHPNTSPPNLSLSLSLSLSFFLSFFLTICEALAV